MVSVIMPAFNRKKTVLDAVNSVLEQTYRNIELIVVDDGSTDGTAEVLSKIDDSRFKYVYQENAGACAARNRGIELARGEYIAFHDSDDIWHKDKIKKQIFIFEKINPDIVFCKLLKTYPSGKVVVYPEYYGEGFLKPVENLFGIGTQTIMAKRKVFEKYKFDPQMPRFQEFEMLFRATKEFSIYCVDEALVDYKIGEDSISGNPMKLKTACEIFLKKHPDIREYPIMVDIMAHGLLTGANTMKRDGNSCYKELVRLAGEYSKSPKLRIKTFLVCAGVYDLSRKIRHKE